MARGGKRQGAGRPKGSLNKLTVDVMQQLQEVGCNPIVGMATIAMDEDNAPELRGRMFAELAKYVAPQRKAVDHTSTDGSVNTGPQEIVVRVVRPTLTVVGSDAA